MTAGSSPDPMSASDPKTKRQCSAHSRTGKQCKRWAVPGAIVCRYHGGMAPQVRAAADRRLVEAEVRRITGADPMTDPYAALEDLGGRAMALVDRLSHLVDDLDDVRYEGGLGGHWEQVRGELPMLLAALRQAESIAGRIVSLGLDAQRNQISNRKADMVAAALLFVLGHADIGLDPQRLTRARELLMAELETRDDS
jgi:hypothetical protein